LLRPFRADYHISNIPTRSEDPNLLRPFRADYHISTLPSCPSPAARRLLRAGRATFRLALGVGPSLSRTRSVLARRGGAQCNAASGPPTSSVPSCPSPAARRLLRAGRATFRLALGVGPSLSRTRSVLARRGGAQYNAASGSPTSSVPSCPSPAARRLLRAGRATFRLALGVGPSLSRTRSVLARRGGAQYNAASGSPTSSVPSCPSPAARRLLRARRATFRRALGVGPGHNPVSPRWGGQGFIYSVLLGMGGLSIRYIYRGEGRRLVSAPIYLNNWTESQGGRLVSSSFPKGTCHQLDRHPETVYHHPGSNTPRRFPTSSIVYQ